MHRVLELMKGNKTRACKILGFDRRTMYRKLRDEEEARQAEKPKRPEDPS